MLIFFGLRLLLLGVVCDFEFSRVLVVSFLSVGVDRLFGFSRPG